MSKGFSILRMSRSKLILYPRQARYFDANYIYTIWTILDKCIDIFLSQISSGYSEGQEECPKTVIYMAIYATT